MSLPEEDGERRQEEALKATTASEKQQLRKILMANSSQHQPEEQGREQQHQEKRKATALETSVATGDEERKKRTKVVFKCSLSSSQQQQQQQQRRQQTNTASSTAVTEEKETEIWRKTASQKGLSEPRLYFSKTVTTTDTKIEQNRYEIGVQDMVNRMSLQELAIRVNSRPSVNVIVMDKKGREYQVFFRYIPSNGRYRFNGPEWRKFMEDNELQAGQIINIYELRDSRGGNYGFAFINT